MSKHWKLQLNCVLAAEAYFHIEKTQYSYSHSSPFLLLEGYFYKSSLEFHNVTADFVEKSLFSF